MIAKKLLGVLLPLLLLAGCSLFGHPNDPIDTLEEARTQWANQQITSYSVHEEVCCTVVRPYLIYSRVIVRNGKAEELAEIDEDIIKDEMDYSMALKSAKTVEEMFARVEHKQREDPDSLFVEYNQEYGYPSHFFVHQNFKMPDAVYEMKMSDLRVISREK